MATLTGNFKVGSTAKSPYIFLGDYVLTQDAYTSINLEDFPDEILSSLTNALANGSIESSNITTENLRDFVDIVQATASGGSTGTSGAVTIVDGGDATFGAKNDTEASTDTATASFMSLFKRLLQRVTTLLGVLPSSLGQQTSANSLSVSIASDQDFATATLQTTGNTTLSSMQTTQTGISSKLDTLITNSTSDPATATLQGDTNTKLDTLITNSTSDPATATLQTTGNTTLASILAKIIAAPATSALQTTGNTALTNILAKIIANPATDTLQTAANTLLAQISTQLPDSLGQTTMTESVSVAIASDQSAITVQGSLPVTITATITSGESISDDIDLGTGVVSMIVYPTDWTTATSTFQISYDGTNWADLYDDAGVEIEIGAEAAVAIRLNLSDWLGIKYLRIRSGTSATAVAQGDDRSIMIITVPR